MAVITAKLRKKEKKETKKLGVFCIGGKKSFDTGIPRLSAWVSMVGNSPFDLVGYSCCFQYAENGRGEELDRTTETPRQTKCVERA
jgi:hypothetical protein